MGRELAESFTEGSRVHVERKERAFVDVFQDAREEQKLLRPRPLDEARERIGRDELPLLEEPKRIGARIAVANDVVVVRGSLCNAARLERAWSEYFERDPRVRLRA